MNLKGFGELVADLMDLAMSLTSELECLVSEVSPLIREEDQSEMIKRD